MNLDCPEFDALGPYIGFDQARSLRAIPVKSSPIVVTRLLKEVGNGEQPRLTLPRCDAYYLMVYLEDTVHSDILSDGSIAAPRQCGRGSICVVDLSEGASVVLHRNLSSLAVYLPKQLIAEVADLSFPPMAHELRCRRAEPDSVVSNLAVVLLSLFEGQSSSPEAILRHMAIALCTHLLQDCLDGDEIRQDTSLPHKREAAAKEFMRRNLARELSVSEIAAVTGLSANHFSQGFKKVTGLTPHQWLMQVRVETATDLLRQHELTIKEIADACGFVDQSHFTKVFAREVGETPAVWRSKRVN